MKKWIKDKMAWLKTFNSPPVVTIKARAIVDASVVVEGRAELYMEAKDGSLPEVKRVKTIL